MADGDGDKKKSGGGAKVGKTLLKWAPKVLIGTALITAFASAAAPGLGLGAIIKGVITENFTNVGAKLGVVSEAAQNSFHNVFPNVGQ